MPFEKNKKDPALPPCIHVLAQKQAVCVVLSYILGVDEEKKQKKAVKMKAVKIKTGKKKSLKRRKKSGISLCIKVHHSWGEAANAEG